MNKPVDPKNEHINERIGKLFRYTKAGLEKKDARYYADIENAARNHQPKEYPNGKAEHASIDLAKFFEYGTGEICLFSGQLRERAQAELPVYSWIILQEAVLSFLRREGTKLRIILEKNADYIIPDGHALLKTIADAKDLKGSVELFRLNGNTDGRTHFCVSDTGYREEINDSDCTAVSNFGDQQKAATLKRDFENLLKKATGVWEVRPI